MKKLLLLAVFMAFMGCVKTPEGTEKIETTDNYKVVSIDGCEYIQVDDYLNTDWAIYSLTHKGNCKNPYHIGTVEVGNGLIKINGVISLDTNILRR